MTKSNSSNGPLGWALFWSLLIVMLSGLSFVFNWLWLIYVPILLVLFFIMKYKENRVETLWVTLVIVFTILIILVAGLTFADSMSFITGTEWKRVDTNICEKEMAFIGLDDGDCTKIITSFLSEKSDNPKLVNVRNNYSVNHSVGLVINPTTIPQCYEERCK